MTFAHYSGTARQYIREYLDPDNTFEATPTSEDEAYALYAQLEEVFREDGGTGMDEDEFVEAIYDIQTSSGFPDWYA